MDIIKTISLIAFLFSVTTPYSLAAGADSNQRVASWSCEKGISLPSDPELRYRVEKGDPQPIESGDYFIRGHNNIIQGFDNNSGRLVWCFVVKPENSVLNSLRIKNDDIEAVFGNQTLLLSKQNGHVKEGSKPLQQAASQPQPDNQTITQRSIQSLVDLDTLFQNCSNYAADSAALMDKYDWQNRFNAAKWVHAHDRQLVCEQKIKQAKIEEQERRAAAEVENAKKVAQENREREEAAETKRMENPAYREAKLRNQLCQDSCNSQLLACLNSHNFNSDVCGPPARICVQACGADLRAGAW